MVFSLSCSVALTLSHVSKPLWYLGLALKHSFPKFAQRSSTKLKYFVEGYKEGYKDGQAHESDWRQGLRTLFPPSAAQRQIERFLPPGV